MKHVKNGVSQSGTLEKPQGLPYNELNNRVRRCGRQTGGDGGYSVQLGKVIIVPDSFKGSLSSSQAAGVIAGEVLAAFPNCTVVKMPIADGGEGSVDTVLSVTGGETYEALVLSPDDSEINARYGVIGSGTAILEMAQSSGLTRQNGLHPMSSSTYGFGQLILAALDLGIRDFLLCIGGSATTDGGCGMAAALGVRFLDGFGNGFVPCGGTLGAIARWDDQGMDARIRQSAFTVLCDVDNPLSGPRGAACVYAPQKGANPAQVRLLDDGLRRLGELLAERYGEDYAGVPGAGAAGGLGAGCMAFLGAKLKSGIETILDICGFSGQLADTDLIITGEGKLDEQSFQGKVLSGILRRAGNVPVCSICGVRRCDEARLREHGILAFEASEGISIEDSMADPERYIRLAAQRAMRTIKEGGIAR